MKPADFGIKNFETFRPHQLEVAVQVYAATENGIKYALANLPCGSGKTLMALTVARQRDEQFTYIARDIALQYQCYGDFKSLGAELLLGRNNYPCLKHPEYPADICDKRSLICERCVLAKTGCKPDEKMRCTCREVCPYEIQKFKTLLAPISILNPEYFLYEANNVGMFSSRGFVTIDEADVLESILMEFIQLSVSDSMVAKYGLTHPRFKTKPESWQQWARETTEIVNNQLSKYNGLFGVEDLREQQKLERLKSKLLFFEKEANDNWIFDSVSNVFKPIRVAPYCEQFLWRHAEKFLLMSATLSPMSQLCADLGIDIKDAACYDVPSIFPPEHNLVHVRPVADMSFKANQDSEFPKMILELDHILDEHPNSKGLIHAVSYSRRDRILRTSRHYARFITHQPNNRQVMLNQFIASPEPLVFLSPAVERGIDLRDDLCRFIVLTKMPFSNLHEDKQAAARYYSNKDGKRWYASQTARRIVQCLGRGCRSVDDYCSNYILDSNFIKFYRENKLMFPRWWRDTVKLEDKREVMTV